MKILNPFPNDITRRVLSRHGLALLAAGLMIAPTAHAANLQWTTTAGPITDGAGTWNQGSASSAGAWYDGTSYNVIMNSGDNVKFGGGTAGANGAIAVPGSVNPGNMTFTAANGGNMNTFSGVGPIIMNGGTMTNLAGKNQQIAVPTSGSFTVVGAQGVTLTANGTQTGADKVTVNASSKFGLGLNTGAGNVGTAVITNNGTLTWNYSGGFAKGASNAVYGSGSVVFQLPNSQILTVYSNLTHTGTTTFQENGSGGGTMTLAMGGVNVLSASSDFVMTNNANPTTAINQLNLVGFDQAIGSLSAISPATTANCIITNSSLTSTNTLTIAGAGKSTTYSGLLAGPLNLTMNGNGSTLTFSGANTYLGNTIISAGTLVGVVGGSSANSPVTIAATSAKIAALGVSVTDITKQWACPSLTNDNTAGVSSGLVFNFGALTPSTSLAPLNVLGSVTATTPIGITINGSSLPVSSGNGYPLLTWGSGSAPAVSLSSVRYAANLHTNGNTIYLQVTGSSYQFYNLTWTTTGGGLTDGAGTWNQDSASATAGGGAWYNGASYGITMSAGDNVLFGGGTAGTNGIITVAVTGVSPGNIILTNANGGNPYTFTGGAITMNGGTISNLTALGYNIGVPVNGSFTVAQTPLNGTVALQANGTQTSANTITNNGGIALSQNTSAGSMGSAVIVNNGTLSFGFGTTRSVSNAISGAGKVSFGSRAGTTITVYSNLTHSGTTTFNEVGTTFAGTATLVLGGANVLSASSDFVITNNLAPTTIVTNLLDLAGNGQTISSLAATGNATTDNCVITNSGAAATLTLAGAGRTTAYNGRLVGPLNLTLNGSGSKLLLNGTTDSGGVVTVTNATLGGSGTIGGATTIQSNGTIAPGSGSVGALTVNNNLTLNAGAGALFRLNTTNTPATNDSLIVTGTQSITTSTLTVTNLGPALVVGDSFKLLNQTTSGFATVNLPAGYTWTNRLAIDGSIQVLTVVSTTPTPTNITAAITGNQLVLNWPAGQGWLLQSNSVNLADTNSWFTVTPTPTPPVTNNIDPAKTAVFYRLKY